MGIRVGKEKGKGKGKGLREGGKEGKGRKWIMGVEVEGVDIAWPDL